jgi:diguanylate cyclase
VPKIATDDLVRAAAEPSPDESPETILDCQSEEYEALRRGIQYGEFEVHYQPIVNLPAEDLFAVEALVRWRRDGVVIPARSFIAVAERSGLINLIGNFVLVDALRNSSGLSALAAKALWFVNMSAVELLQPAKVGDVREALERHRADPSRIVIEISERSDVLCSEQALRVIGELAALGLGIAIDDFGAGPSSLELLRSMPISYLKFDRALTADLGLDPVADDLLERCLDLALRLGVLLVAEGVESSDQRARLVAAGVALAQGYFFAVPQRISELHATTFGST